MMVLGRRFLMLLMQCAIPTSMISLREMYSVCSLPDSSFFLPIFFSRFSYSLKVQAISLADSPDSSKVSMPLKFLTTSSSPMEFFKISKFLAPIALITKSLLSFLYLEGQEQFMLPLRSTISIMHSTDSSSFSHQRCTVQFLMVFSLMSSPLSTPQYRQRLLERNTPQSRQSSMSTSAEIRCASFLYRSLMVNLKELEIPPFNSYTRQSLLSFKNCMRQQYLLDLCQPNHIQYFWKHPITWSDSLHFMKLQQMINHEEDQEIQGLPWTTKHYFKKWASKSAQSVNSPQYKELRHFIHRPYRKIDNQGVKCYYFPTYVIFKVKNITQFNFQSLSARINGVLIIDIQVDYRDQFSPNKDNLDESEVREALQNLFNFRYDKKEKKKEEKEEAAEEDIQATFKRNYLFVQFNRDNPLRLPTKRIFEGQIGFSADKAEVGYRIKWTIRKQFQISLAPGTIFQDLIAPFNLLNFRLSLIFQDIDVELPGSDRKTSEFVKFKFNCMKRVGNDSSEEKKRIFEQLMFTDDGSLGEYDLAETSLSVKCEKFRTEEALSDNADSYRSYKVITFNIPFYKYPIMDSLTIFIPLVLITILTLFTFVQGPDYNDKIGNIATLMIVYVGLVPVISESLPPTTSITLIDIVVYCQLLINVLCLIRGYTIKNYTVDEFSDYKIWSDPIFIVAVTIAIMTGIILISLLVYYCIMKSFYYNLEEADIDESQRNILHWVSPHMYNQARNVKTVIKKVMEERMNNSNNAASSKMIQ